MGKSVFIAEKPSVAKEFAKTLKETFKSGDGFLESENYIVTWCVGHLVSMSYPEEYDPALKKWSLESLPFIPSTYKYGVIDSVKKQFNIVKTQLTRPDVETVFVCTDSGREGEYIYRLVRQQAGVTGKKEKRVWIDSQTEEEIIKGIKTAKDLSEYDNLSDAAYLRAKEDYLMGINFSRAMTLIYGNNIANAIGERSAVLAMGRVMTCVLGMVVRREREIRAFTPQPFFKVNALTQYGFKAEWKLSEGSAFAGSDKLYKDTGFTCKETALELAEMLAGDSGILVSFTPKDSGSGQDGGNTETAETLESEGFIEATVLKAEKKTEKKNAPLLYNLAELQNDCAKIFKISPDDTLKIVQELYEKKLTTYPRTDARVISTAVAKEIAKNINGLKAYAPVSAFAEEIISGNMHGSIAKSRYCDDKKITDHYAVIPTGFGLNALGGLSQTAQKIYELITRRFLSIFYEPAVYQKTGLTILAENETFTASFKALTKEGYLKVAKASFNKAKSEDTPVPDEVKAIKKGDIIKINALEVKEGETTPPKRYNSGSIILAMENAGQLIEDEDLRAEIKGSGIGTSATRAEILKKLNLKKYIKTNSKTQILTPTLFGELVFDAAYLSLPQLLSPELTASWEKGLTMVVAGEVSSEEYMKKLEDFVRRRTAGVVQGNKRTVMYDRIRELKKVYGG